MSQLRKSPGWLRIADWIICGEGVSPVRMMTGKVGLAVSKARRGKALGQQSWRRQDLRLLREVADLIVPRSIKY
jgi:hypothetical protein